MELTATAVLARVSLVTVPDSYLLTLSYCFTYRLYSGPLLSCMRG